MNEIERYVGKVCRTVGGSADLRRHLREELLAHLEEAVDAKVSEGLSREEAVKVAIDDFGDLESIEKELERVHGRSLLGVVVAKAMQWKERTMKSTWKWSFAASFVLAATLAAQMAFFFFFAVKVMPCVREMASSWNREPMASVKGIVALTAFIGANLHIIIALFLTSWLLFEWRCRSERKPFIRNIIGSSLVLALTCLNGYMVVVLFVDTMQTHLYIQAEGETVIRNSYAESILLREDLSRAMKERDWRLVSRTAADLRNNLGSLSYKRQSAAIIAVESQRDRVADIHESVESLANMADRLAVRAGAPRVFQGSPAEKEAEMRTDAVQIYEQFEKEWLNLEALTVGGESG